MKRLATGDIRDALQCIEIDFVFARRARVAYAYGVDHQLVILRNIRCAFGRNGAAGVVAIGQQDQHLLLGL